MQTKNILKEVNMDDKVKAQVNEILFPGKSIPQNARVVPIQTVAGKYPTLVVRKSSPITILYFHGNNETIYDAYRLYTSLNLSCTFIVPEYAGYSVRGGKETEKSCLAMAEEMLVFASAFKGALIVAGYSIGSGPATHLANYYSNKIFGLILINPFLSIRTWIKDKIGMASVLIRERFNNAKNLKQWRGKLITICGKRDNQISFIHGIMLHEKCPSRYKKIIIHENAGHDFSDWRECVFKPVFDAWFGIHK